MPLVRDFMEFRKFHADEGSAEKEGKNQPKSGVVFFVFEGSEKAETIGHAAQKQHNGFCKGNRQPIEILSGRTGKGAVVDLWVVGIVC